eukprot:6183724-Pleurochrysis_carterae.AAC.3
MALFHESEKRSSAAGLVDDKSTQKPQIAMPPPRQQVVPFCLNKSAKLMASGQVMRVLDQVKGWHRLQQNLQRQITFLYSSPTTPGIQLEQQAD